MQPLLVLRGEPLIIFYQLDKQSGANVDSLPQPECPAARSKRTVNSSTRLESRQDIEPVATASALARHNNSSMSFDVYSGLFVNDLGEFCAKHRILLH